MRRYTAYAQAFILESSGEPYRAWIYQTFVALALAESLNIPPGVNSGISRHSQRRDVHNNDTSRIGVSRGLARPSQTSKWP